MKGLKCMGCRADVISGCHEEYFIMLSVPLLLAGLKLPVLIMLLDFLFLFLAVIKIE